MAVAANGAHAILSVHKKFSTSLLRATVTCALSMEISTVTVRAESEVSRNIVKHPGLRRVGHKDSGMIQTRAAVAKGA